MAELVLLNLGVTVNSVDLTDHVKSAELNYSADQQEITAMTDGTRERLPGLLDHSLSLTLNQDFSTGSVDATLFPLIGATGFPIVLRVVSSAARSSANPEFGADYTLESYNPIGNAVGEAAVVTASFVANTALARTVSAT